MCEVMERGNPVGLTLLLGGEPNSKLVEVLSSEAMKNVVDHLREQFDVVVLDTPPSAILVDAMMLVRYVDAVAYVVMNDFARRRYIFNGVEELMAGDAPIVGCILNGGKVRSGLRPVRRSDQTEVRAGLPRKRLREGSEGSSVKINGGRRGTDADAAFR